MFQNFQVSKNPPKNEGCCSTQKKQIQTCPQCNNISKAVLAKTLQSLLTQKAQTNITCYENFYFCTTPSCATIYFNDATSFTQKDVSVSVGLKNGASPATVCYCFGWSKEKILQEIQENGATTALEDIKEKMKMQGCSCETLNPSGRCCLGDVGLVIKKLQNL